MKITVTRAFYLAGEAKPVGTVVDVDDKFARELIHMGKAARVDDAAPAAAAEIPAADPKPAKGRK